MPGLFLSRCFFGKKPTTWPTIPETEMTWGASWRETNMPSEQPAPSTGCVWARHQVIQHPGFKPPWYQEEQRNAIHIGSWPKCTFMAKTMLLFWKIYSVFNNWNNLSLASLSHTILYIPHRGSHHPVWPRRFCLLHQKWEIFPPNFSYKEASIHNHPGDQREPQKWRHSMSWISHHGTQNAGAQRSGICWYNVSLPLLVVIFLFSAEWWH